MNTNLTAYQKYNQLYLIPPTPPAIIFTLVENDTQRILDILLEGKHYEII